MMKRKVVLLGLFLGLLNFCLEGKAADSQETGAPYDCDKHCGAFADNFMKNISAPCEKALNVEKMDPDAQTQICNMVATSLAGLKDIIFAKGCVRLCKANLQAKAQKKQLAQSEAIMKAGQEKAKGAGAS